MEKSYYERNKEELLAKAKEYRAKNPEKIKKIYRDWRMANEGHTYIDKPSGYVIWVGYNHPAASSSGLTREHRIVMWDKLGFEPGKDNKVKCNWCPDILTWDILTVDHVNFKRDDNRPENLVPSCMACNMRRKRPLLTDIVTVVCSFEGCDREAMSEFNTLCKTHYGQKWRGKELTEIAARNRNNFETQERYCPECDEWLDFVHYYKRKNGHPFGLCKPHYLQEIKDKQEARRRGR